MAKKKNDVVEQEKIHSAGEVENAADAGEALVEEVRSKGGGNEWATQAQTGTSASTGRSASRSESESHQEQKQVYDPAMHKANVEAVNKGFEDGTYQSFAKMIMPQIEKEIDPAEAERKKKNADFRRSMHEVVSALQVMSDIGTSFAGGNAYKREAPNYKQYQAEKDKIDSARDAAMKRLYEAQAMDANYKNRLMEMAYQKSFVNHGDSTSSQVGEGVQSNSGVTTNQSAARSQQAFASSSSSTPSKTDNTTPKSDFYTTVNVNNEKGERIGQQRINFRSENDMNSYYNALTRMVVQDNGTKNKTGVATPMYQAANYAFRRGGDMLHVLFDPSNKTITDKERYNKFRSLLQGQKVTITDSKNKKHDVQLTQQQKRNILNSVMLTNDEYIGLLQGINYEIVGHDNGSNSNIDPRNNGQRNGTSDATTGLKEMP